MVSMLARMAACSSSVFVRAAIAFSASSFAILSLLISACSSSAQRSSFFPKGLLPFFERVFRVCDDTSGT